MSGDGVLDLVSSGSPAILLGDGAGGFGAPTVTAIRPGTTLPKLVTLIPTNCLTLSHPVLAKSMSLLGVLIGASERRESILSEMAWTQRTLMAMGMLTW